MKPTPLLVLLLAAIAAPLPARAAPWYFAVFGDSRDRGSVGTETGVVSAISKKIVELSSAQPCSAVLFVGDLIRGQIEDASNTLFSSEYRAAKSALKPLYDAHIPFYPCRGNHETYGNPVLHDVPPDQAWREAFSNDIPANGPTNELFMTYSFATNNALFISMDQYDGNSNNAEYHLMASLPWMTNVLAANTNPFVFVMGHEPAFNITTATNVEGEVEVGLNAHLTDRDTFWNELGQAGVSTYFCGHLHLQSLGEATDFYGHVIAHMLIGNGGAPADPYDGRVAESNRLVQLSCLSQTFGFVYVAVDGPTYRMTSYELNTNDWTWKVGYAYTPVSIQAVNGGPSQGTMALTFNSAVNASNTVRAYPDVPSLDAGTGSSNLSLSYIPKPGVLTNVTVALPANWSNGVLSIESP